MTKFSFTLATIGVFFMYVCNAQPSRFCSRLTRDCTTECRENSTNSILECTIDCVCLDEQISSLLSYEECSNFFGECRGNNCNLNRYFNDLCSNLPGSCCDPNTLDFVQCLNNSTEPLCCDGEWICPIENNEDSSEDNNEFNYNCPNRLISSECCCDTSSDFNCQNGERQCCPNNGEWTCPMDFASNDTLYVCSDGNLYDLSEMAYDCCCDPYEEPGRFGNEECRNGKICCPDGTWSCGTGNERFQCGEGQPQRRNDINEGEVCICQAPEICNQVLICCDERIFNTPCQAQEACYDTNDEQFCTTNFISVGDGACVPGEQNS